VYDATRTGTLLPFSLSSSLYLFVSFPAGGAPLHFFQEGLAGVRAPETGRVRPCPRSGELVGERVVAISGQPLLALPGTAETGRSPVRSRSTSSRQRVSSLAMPKVQPQVVGPGPGTRGARRCESWWGLHRWSASRCRQSPDGRRGSDRDVTRPFVKLEVARRSLGSARPSPLQQGEQVASKSVTTGGASGSSGIHSVEGQMCWAARSAPTARIWPPGRPA